jgi:hypothetical protein
MRQLILFFGVVLLSACGSNSDRSIGETRWPDRPPAGLSISDRKIEALIQCYKIIILAQDRYSGVGAKGDGVAATLSPARRMIEDRVVGDLTQGREKMRVNEKVESELQQLLRDKPYGSAEILLEGARYCAGLEERNAWREMQP